MSRFWCQKGHFTEGSKTCFAYMSFKLTLYKNRYVYKLCASGGTVTQYWAFVDIAKHFPCDFEYFYRGGWGAIGGDLLCAVFSCIYAYVSLPGCIFLLLYMYTTAYFVAHTEGGFSISMFRNCLDIEAYQSPRTTIDT